MGLTHLQKNGLFSASKGKKEFDCMVLSVINVASEHASIRNKAQQSGPTHKDTIIAPGGGSAPAMCSSRKLSPPAPPLQTDSGGRDDGPSKDAGKAKMKPAGLDLPTGSSHAIRAFAIDPMVSTGMKIYCSTSRGDIWTVDFGSKKNI